MRTPVRIPRNSLVSFAASLSLSRQMPHVSSHLGRCLMVTSSEVPHGHDWSGIYLLAYYFKIFFGKFAQTLDLHENRLETELEADNYINLHGFSRRF